MRFHRFLFTISCLISLSVLSAPGQTSFSTFETRPGSSHPEVRDIDPANATFAAFTTNLDGRVTVSVLIDENGNVSSVERVTGPGNICPSVTRPDVVALRDTAAKAARMVTFVPAKMGDQPTSSEGTLYFDIVKQSSDVPDKVPEKKYTADYVGPVQGQTNSSSNRYKVASPSEIQSTSVLNGKARSLPKPPYPPAARAVRASGPVTIQVLIETDGSVFSSEAVSGHPLLRAAARNAACEAIFSPTLLSGQPVKVSGIVTYNFIAP
jgi:outer membrane biosynthesis protein TonB